MTTRSGQFPAVLALSLSSLFALAAAPSRRAATMNPAATITVDAALNRHAIDPRIYGVAFADSATMTDLSIPLNRWGGNAMSRYNWIISTANRCKDYYFENVPDTVAGDGSNGQSADQFIQPTLAAGGQPIMTIPMMGLLPKDRSYRCGFSIAKYGPQNSNDAMNRPDCGDGRPAGNPNGRLLGVADPFDTAAVYPSSHQGDWIQHNIDTFGPASTTGVKYYALDNEPSLWSFDHWDVHSTGSTYDEVWGKMQEYGAMIRAKDPSALITGIEEWGWSGYFASGLDQENYPDQSDRNAHGGTPYAEWLLQQARAYEQTHGVRILDFASVHFYPQGGEFSDDLSDVTRLLRNRSTRSLWDPNYQDESWIGGTGIDGGHVRLIPRLRQWAAADYPGTKIGITEYNWGAEGDVNGATAQADILGIFGREALDLGVRWTSPPAGSNVYNAIKMYRNYDGLHSKFGDLSVGASGPNPDDVAVFAALRSSDRALTVMIISKTLTGSTPVTVNLADFTATANAQRYQLDGGNVITHLGDVAVAGSSASLSVPSPGITLLVIPGSYVDSPAGVVATATSTSNVHIVWNSVPAASSYEIYRSSLLSAGFALDGTSATTTFDDGGRATNTTYLYTVRAISGPNASGMSALDAATTTVFTDDPLNAGTPAKRQHITELRTAVDAMRAASGLAPGLYTDPSLSAGTVVKRIHLVELRAALDQARATLGLSAGVWTDPAITQGLTAVKAAHIVAVRNGVK